MANLIRSAKSGSEWTLNDLNSFHIVVHQVDLLLFFGLKELPPPSVHQELLSNAHAGAMTQDDHAQFITYVEFAMIPERGRAAG